MLDRIRWKEKTSIALVAVVILAFTGPFGTFSALSFTGRLTYWAFTVVSVGAVINATVALIVGSGWFSRVSQRAAIFGGVVVGAIPGTGVVYMIEWLGYGTGHHASPAWFIYLAVLVISVGIALVGFRFDIVGNNPETPSGSVAEKSLFDRLDPMIGRDLISLSNQDHYLEVQTTRGKDTVLYCIADAVIELQDLEGLQIHRSHWVALAHVTKLRRKGSSYLVALTDGRSLPVSRQHVKPLRLALSDAVTRSAQGG